ncbi:phiSA1p31-related protein [Streptomyces europaeiscabiei]|uniref:phiSA1p31-related protein n=1 Tax=Streptomyces europaeiscabiei TaxID=146819 RepID=UPI0029B83146|nr:phiSA1p31-related protein [Streptomyces europaeiscabiei]MDX3839808.1 phiSA1p31-related protein [Streptomyces europaeiscabiei]
MTPYLHDGTVFDLDRAYADVTGVEWAWTGARNSDGEPLMISVHRGDRDEDLKASTVSLPDLYRYHGPLIPMPRPTTASTYRRILAQGTAA